MPPRTTATLTRRFWASAAVARRRIGGGAAFAAVGGSGGGDSLAAADNGGGGGLGFMTVRRSLSLWLEVFVCPDTYGDQPLRKVRDPALVKKDQPSRIEGQVDEITLSTDEHQRVALLAVYSPDLIVAIRFRPFSASAVTAK
jgi:hypothetical protein